LIVTISMSYMEIGLYIVVVILVIRFAVATGVARIIGFTRQEKVITRLIFAQGLPAFVMSQLPFIFDPHRQYFLDPEIYPNLAVPIVLGTVLFSAITGPVIAKKQLT
jgi:Kef-type K+ transport system membrane component KefB